MIQYNELRISQDKKYLIIDVQIQEMDYYENVTLQQIIINTQDEYNVSGPNISISEDRIITECSGKKHYRTFFPIDGIADNLFFVYTIADGEPTPDTPCGMKDQWILGVAYDKYPMYLKGIQYISQLNKNCEPPSDLIDYILQHKAFDLSLLTGNYLKAIDYWKMFKDSKEKTVTRKCGCG